MNPNNTESANLDTLVSLIAEAVIQRLEPRLKMLEERANPDIGKLADQILDRIDLEQEVRDTVQNMSFSIYVN